MTPSTLQQRVLIAEHIVPFAEEIAEGLSERGYQITGIARSNEQATELAAKTIPDIVLMNIALPGEMDSITAACKIYSKVNCPVVYVTDYGVGSAIEQEVQRSNPYGYLIKPFTLNELISAIKDALWLHWFNQATASQWIDSSPISANTDQQFLGILGLASILQPIPRIFFEDDVLKIYVNTPGAAQILVQACQSELFSCRYQVYLWTTEIEQCYLYAHG